MTYTANVTAPSWCTVLMSALSQGTVPGAAGTDEVIHKWSQPVNTSTYLIALAAGKLASRDISPRVRVWSEPEVIEKVGYAILSVHPINPSYQYTLSIHPISTPYQYTLSVHSINTLYQYTLSTHPINLSDQCAFLTPSIKPLYQKKSRMDSVKPKKSILSISLLNTTY